MKNDIFGINFVNANENNGSNENNEQNNPNKKGIIWFVAVGMCFTLGIVCLGIFTLINNNMNQTITIVNGSGNDSDTIDTQEQFSKLVEVPDVKGYPKEDAIQILQENHLKFRLDVDFNGYEETQYVVKKQSLDPDSTVEADTVIELTLVPV